MLAAKWMSREFTWLEEFRMDCRGQLLRALIKCSAIGYYRQKSPHLAQRPRELWGTRFRLLFHPSG